MEMQIVNELPVTLQGYASEWQIAAVRDRLKSIKNGYCNQFYLKGGTLESIGDSFFGLDDVVLKLGQNNMDFPDWHFDEFTTQFFEVHVIDGELYFLRQHYNGEMFEDESTIA